VEHHLRWAAWAGRWSRSQTSARAGSCAPVRRQEAHCWSRDASHGSGALDAARTLLDPIMFIRSVIRRASGRRAMWSSGLRANSSPTTRASRGGSSHRPPCPPRSTTTRPRLVRTSAATCPRALPRPSVELMSNDLPRLGPPAAPPSVGSTGALPAGSSKPAATSSTALAGATAVPKPPAAKGRGSIFERVRDAALRANKPTAGSSTSSPGGSAAAAAAAPTTSAPGSPALAPPVSVPRPAVSSSLKPVQAQAGTIPPASKVAPAPAVALKPSDEADEAAIDHALFSSPPAPDVALPLPPPSTSSARPSAGQALTSNKPAPAARPPSMSQPAMTFKKRVSALGDPAATPAFVRSPATAAVGERRPSLGLGDKVRSFTPLASMLALERLTAFSQAARYHRLNR
jgi:hypothetical protein